MANKFTDAMRALAAELEGHPRWHPYAGYCEARANNLREQAATAAEHFAEIAKVWPFAERKQFSLWLMDRTGWIMERSGGSRFRSRFSTGGPGLFAPRLVVETVLRPTLAEWRDHEPTNAEPHFWLGLYDDNPGPDLREAIRLDPAHGSARAALALLFINAVDYNQHELPSGYVGDPTDDLPVLAEADAFLTELVDPAVRADLKAKISNLRASAEDWIALRDRIEALSWEARKSSWRARRSAQNSGGREAT